MMSSSSSIKGTRKKSLLRSRTNEDEAKVPSDGLTYPATINVQHQPPPRGSTKKSLLTNKDESKLPCDGLTDPASTNVQDQHPPRGPTKKSLLRSRTNEGSTKKSVLRSKTNEDEAKVPSDVLTDLASINIQHQPHPFGSTKKSLLKNKDEAKVPSDGLTDLACINVQHQPPRAKIKKLLLRSRTNEGTTSKPSPEKCFWCRGVHSPGNCPNDFCVVCNSTKHTRSYCPYLEKFPRGSKFNTELFEIYCVCDCPLFDTDNWVCPSEWCSGEVGAKLVPKDCIICSSQYHTTYECPKDKGLAADCKSSMEKYYLDPC